MIKRLELVSKLRATPSHYWAADMALKRQRHLVAPPPIHHSSPQWGNQHLITLGLSIVWNTSNPYWIQGNYTTSPTHLAGTSCGGHGPRWQIQPNRSSSDGPRQSCPVLWVVIFRRRTELGWGVRCHIHAVRSHWLGWQTSPSQCQPSEPRWRPVVDCPSHHQMMHQTQGPRHPHSIQPASLPFNFCNQDQSPWRAKHKTAAEWWEVTRCDYYTRNEAMHYKKAKTETRGNETNGLPHPHHLCLHQIAGSRVTKVQCWLPPQCHWGLIDLEVPGIHTMADSTAGSLEVTWRSTWQSSKMRTWKMPSPTKVGAGI